MTRIEEVIHEHLATAGQDKLDAVFHAIDDKIRIQAMQSALDDLASKQAAFEANLLRIKGAVKEALSAIDAMDPVGARIILRGALGAK